MRLEPKLIYAASPFDFEAVRQRVEGAAIDAVAKLSVAELCCSRDALINRLRVEIELKAPKLPLAKVSQFVTDSEGFQCAIETQLADPSDLACYISLPAFSPLIEYDFDRELERLSVS